MSTASDSTRSTENQNGQYAKFDEYVDYQVSRTGSHIKANDLLTTAVGITTIFLGYLLIFILCDHWLIKGGFGHSSRLIMLSGVVLACLSWSVWKLVIPYFKKVTRLYSAHALEQTSEEMHGALLNLIDLKKSERKINPEILSSLEKRAALSLSHTDTEQAVDRRPLMRLSYGLLFVVALLCFYALFSPKQIWPSLSAAISFSPQREFATQTQISSVTPGNTEVLSGSQLEVIVDLRGEVPETIMLYYTSSDQGRVDEPVKLRAMDETLKRYQGLIVGVNGRGIRQPLKYRIEAGDAVSEEYQVSVIQPPSATVHSIRYEYPSYMELAAVEQPGGAIDAYEGTKVTVDATTNMPISSFEVLFSDTEDSASLFEEFQVEKTIDKNSITASWKLKLRSDGTFPKFYQIKCRNEAGQTTLSPTVYPLMIRRDLPPEIALLSPKQDLKLPSNGTVPLSVVAEDPDFKIRYLNLRVEKKQIRILDKTLFEGARQSVGINYDLALEPLRLTPGDIIYFWVEARDNKHPSGNRKNTPKIKIEILEPVSPEEAKQQLEEQKQQAAEQNQKQKPRQQQQSDPQAGKDSQPGQQPAGQPMQNQNQQGKSEEGKQAGDQKQKGDEEQNPDKTGQQKSDSPQPGAEQKQEPGDGTQQQKPGEKEGLDSDGSDDQEALKKILDKLKKEGQQPDSDQSQSGNEKQGSQKQQPDGTGSDKKMQEPKSNGADSNTQQSSPNQEKNSEGTPGKGQNQNKNPQTSSDANDPDQKPSGQKQPPQQGPVPNGKKEPSDSEAADRKMKSDGEANGKAKPNDDPNAKSEQSNKNVKRDPNEKPTLRPGDKQSPDGDPQQKSENSSSKSGQPNNQGEQKPGSEMRKPEPSNQNPSPSGDQKPADPTKSKQNPNQPDGSNQQPKGEPRSNDQKSKRPQDGENGNSSQNDQGQKGSQQPGKGDSTGQKGNQEAGSQKNPSNSKESMKQQESTNQQGENSPNQNQSEQKQNNQQQQQSGKSGGKQGGKSGSKQNGKGSSQGKGESQKGSSQSTGSSKRANSRNPKGSSATSGGTATGDGDSDFPSGESPSLPEADDANLEYGKEAANLVLKRIKDELKRKEVDQDLLEELGWTKEEMQQFSERLQKQLQMQDQNQQQTPESLARKRQFEEMLKSLKPAPQASRRKRTSSRQQTNDSLGPRRLPVPEEYREAYEAFTRGLANQKPADQ